MRFRLNMPFSRCFSALLMPGILAFLAILVFPQVAHAAIVFCNRSANPIEAALGYRDVINNKVAWQSEGWWRIEPEQCARVFGKPLTQRFYYYYATSIARAGKDKSPFVWSGKYIFCTDVKAFKIEGDNDCKPRGFIPRGFHEIDLGMKKTNDYTLDFKDGN